MRVLLINPPAYNGIDFVREGRCMNRKSAWSMLWPPLSLSYIASLLEKERFEVKLLDCIAEDISFKKLKHKIGEFKPRLIIFNTATPSIKGDLVVAAIAKSVDSNIKTAAFGVHPSALPGECFLEEENLDFIIRNEPELTALELSNSIAQNAKVEEILGVSFRVGSKIFHNADRPWLESLDILPYPAWHLIDSKKYRSPINGREQLLINISRGCHYGCSFCTAKVYYGNRFRYRDPVKIVQEIKWAKEKYNVKDFLFWAESFTADAVFVEKLCNKIMEENLRIKWVCNSRVDQLKPHIVKKMKEAGCNLIAFGIESFDENVLSQCRKNIYFFHAKQAIEWCRQAGVKTLGYFIVGLPGESKTSILKTNEEIKKLNLDFLQCSCAVPFPGTSFYQEAVEKAWIETRDFSRFDQSCSILDFSGLTAQEIESFRKKFFLEFYMRPAKALQIFYFLCREGGFKNVINIFKDFLRWI